MIANPTSISDQILNLAEGIGTEMKTLKGIVNTKADASVIGTLSVASGDAVTVENAIAKAKADLQEAINTSVSSVYTVKGTKATYAELPSSGNTTGDVWNVTAANGNTPAGTNYVWTGSEWDALGGTVDLSGYVPTSRTINGQALSADITLSASDVGAVPTTRTINSKALSADVTLTAADLATITPDPYTTFNNAYTAA